MEIYHNLSECKTSNIAYNFLKSRSDKFGPVDIVRTPIKPNRKSDKTVSDTSYSFFCDEDERRCIERVFDIDLSRIPDNKIDSRITRIHSSALAALLCFYDISEEKPLIVKHGGLDLKFTRSELEVPNKCKKGGCSRIDVALFTEDEGTVLFLEAKFSEYLVSGCKEISSQYKADPLFNCPDILPEILYFSGLDDDKPLKICSTERGSGRYREGIKQMLCHYIGAQHYVKLNPKVKKVYLGCILFKFGKDSTSALKDYSKMYKELALNLNALHDNKIEMLNDVMTYQKLFSYNDASNLLPRKVRLFYNL